jgi:transcriptional regulator with XRE-family HTH domain
VQPPTHQPPDSTGPAASARQDSASPTNPSQQPHLPSSSGHQQPFPLLLMQARLSRGWTQQHLADLIGTTPQTVSRWERGIATPGLYHRSKLSALFGLSLAERLVVLQQRPCDIAGVRLRVLVTTAAHLQASGPYGSIWRQVFPELAERERTRRRALWEERSPGEREGLIGPLPLTTMW